MDFAIWCLLCRLRQAKTELEPEAAAAKGVSPRHATKKPALADHAGLDELPKFCSTSCPSEPRAIIWQRKDELSEG